MTTSDAPTLRTLKEIAAHFGIEAPDRDKLAALRGE